MSIFDRYPQPSLNVDDMIALLWKKVCKIEHEKQMPDINNNNNITNNMYDGLPMTLTPHRHARLIFGGENATGNNANYTQLQSHCEDRHFIYCFYAHTDSSIHNVLCRKIAKPNYNIVSEQEYVGGGHANGVTYNPTLERIFMVNSFNDEVYMIDPTTLSIVVTLHTGMDNYTKAIAYDKDRDVYYIGRVTGLPASDMSEVYVYRLIDNNGYAFDLEDQFTVNSWENLGTATQDWAYYNNCLYAMTSKPNAIAIISVDEGTKGERIACFDLHSNECTIGELEGIDNYNGIWRITSSRLSATYGYQHVTQFFDVNNYVGTVSQKVNGDVYSCLQKVPISIYVDINSTTVSPDGTQDNPFKEVWEAIDLVGCAYQNNARIIVKKGSYESIGVHNGASIYIEGTGNDDSGVRGVFVSTGGNLYMKGMRITRNLKMLTERNYGNLLENGGRMTLQNCTLETGSSGDYNVYVNTGSTLTLLNTTLTENNNGRGFLVGDSGLIIRDKLGYSDGMLVTKNNSSGCVLPPTQKVHQYDNDVEVTTSLSGTIRQSERYWQFIELVLIYNSSYMFCKIPTTTTSTNAVVTSAEGYCKFHVAYENDTCTLTCTHNDLTGLKLRAYNFCD